MKRIENRLYTVWIEGEYLLNIDELNHYYTTSRMDAMRVRYSDIPIIKSLMLEQGIAKWAVESSDTFRQVSYAPKGTIFYERNLKTKNNKKTIRNK